MLRLVKIEVDAFIGWLPGAGALPLDVGPYQRAVQLVIANGDANLRRYAGRNAGKKRFVLYEADRPGWLAPSHPNFLIVAAD